MRVLRTTGWGVAILLCVTALLFAIPVTTWRTGEMSMPALNTVPGNTFPALPNRVWIDTDAACGLGQRTDPDDCLAVLALLEDPRINVVGVSTVFGNAPAQETRRVANELVERANLHRKSPVRVFGGSSEPLREGSAQPEEPAHRVIASALAEGPLTIVALGPLTNVAAAAERAPGLQRNVAGIVAVMGRRPGHRFHPSEGTSVGAMLLGHGPVFSDLNFVSDMIAAEQVVRWRRPLFLLPYEVARKVEMDGQALDTLSTRSETGAWVASRSRDWLGFWQSKVGRTGFYPFDLMAAAFVLDPAQFKCADVHVWVGRDPILGVFQRGRALLVADNEQLARSSNVTTRGVYCADLFGGLQTPWPLRRTNGQQR